MRLLPEFEHLAKTPHRQLTTKEVSEATGIPYPTVLSYVTRAVVKLPAQKVQQPRGDHYLITVRDLIAFEQPAMGRPWRRNRTMLNGPIAKTQKKAVGKTVRKKAAKRTKKKKG